MPLVFGLLNAASWKVERYTCLVFRRPREIANRDLKRFHAGPSFMTFLRKSAAYWESSMMILKCCKRIQDFGRCSVALFAALQARPYVMVTVAYITLESMLALALNSFAFLCIFVGLFISLHRPTPKPDPSSPSHPSQLSNASHP